MRRLSWLPVSLLLCQILSIAHGVTISDDCVDAVQFKDKTYNDRTNLQQALESVVRMTQYAVGRAADTNPDHHPGLILQELVGASGPMDAQTLQLVGEWMGKAAAAAQSDKLTIHCTDKHLKVVDAKAGHYIDNRDGCANQVFAPRRKGETLKNDGACGGVNEAFTYMCTTGPVIVLCSDSEVGALRNMVAPHFDHVRQGGDLREVAGKLDKTPRPLVGLDYFGRYLNYKLWHEMMHAAGYLDNPIQYFPAKLPEKDSKGEDIYEQYKYEAITGYKIDDDWRKPEIKPTTEPLSPTNKQHNADGFALLGCAWYLPAYKWGMGLCFAHGPDKRPPDTYPVPAANPPATNNPGTKMVRRERRHFIF